VVQELPVEQGELMHPETWEKQMADLVASSCDGKRLTVRLGQDELVVEAAASPQSRKRGLADLNLEEFRARGVDGMLFMYQTDTGAPYTLARMQFPIHVLFHDIGGNLVYKTSTSQITANQLSEEHVAGDAGDAYYVVKSPDLYRFVLEIPEDRELAEDLDLALAQVTTTGPG
jgi:uncharacterized membrane protein (UPF0127 family)